MQTVDDKRVISGLCWYASDQYRLLITVGGVGGDFSQTPGLQSLLVHVIGAYVLIFCLQLGAGLQLSVG